MLLRFGRWFGWLILANSLAILGSAQPAVNVALNKPVTGTGPTWPGYPAANLTDGNTATFTHPQASANVRGYYFQVDLGQIYLLDRIVLRGRADGCCPERLSNYRVEVYGDRGGETGPLNWAADFRTDGTYPPGTGFDTITAAANPGGLFAGRFVRVLNNSDAAYNPQMGEIEVYGTNGAQVRQFFAEDDALAVGQGTTLHWDVSNATQVTIAPEIGVVSASGSAAVRPAGTTTYTLMAESVAGTTKASVTVGVGVTLGPPGIREFLAENSGGLADEDGDHPDWIELVNTNAFRMNVEGYYLTDDPADLAKWRLPGARIPAQGRLVVFASGKDRKDPAAPMHTNFKLDAKGDFLALVAVDGATVLQQFPADYPATKNFPKQRANISYGLGANGAVGFMRPPTPGGTNGSAFAGIVADTSFSVDRGFYDFPIGVAITCATPGAEIRYTLDRSEPTAAAGTVYSTPLTITKTTVVRAAAFVTGWAPSDVDTQTYVFPSNVIASASMRTSITRHAVYGPQMHAALLDVPSISLVSRQSFNDTSEVKTSFEWLSPDGQPGIHVDCGVQQYGGAFTEFAKKSFRLYFRSEYGAGKLKYPLFAGYEHGIAAATEFDQIELRNGSHDMEQRGFYMSNICTDDTLLEMGRLNPHGRFVHLYINGAYWGLYHLRERWGAAMHQSYLGGSSTNYESINGNWNVGGWAEPGTPYDGDGSVWARIKSLRNKYTAVKPWVDVPEFVDYMLMWMFGGAEDEYRCVGPTTPGSGMKFYLNDADGWFCGPWYCAAGDRTARGSPGRQAGDGPGSLFSMLYAGGDPEYRTLLADQIHQALFSGGALTPGRVAARLTNRCNEIQRAFYAESARWNYLTPSAWASRRDSTLSTWIPKRTGEVLSQWRAAGFYPTPATPTLNQDGGLVSQGFEARFTGPTTGTIYYTTDGTDPRLAGGAVSTGAQESSASPRILIYDNVVLKARARSGARWSALHTAFFQTSPAPVGAGDVRITELNYNPAGVDDAEFVELSNLSDHAVNLRGARFTNGIDFAFSTYRDFLLAPRERAVLVRSLFAFQQLYGLDVPVAGIFSGDLSNGGEEIALVDGAGNLITRFTYDGKKPWPVDADGKGYTLVLAYPQLDPSDPSAWRSSVRMNGTPGGSDAVLFAGDPLADADHDGVVALLEHAFGTSDLDPSEPRFSPPTLDEQGYLTWTLPRNLAADDVITWVEASTDLTTWTSVPRLTSRVDGAGRAIETWGVPASGQPRMFFRMAARGVR